MHKVKAPGNGMVPGGFLPDIILTADNAAPTTIQGGMGEWGHENIRQLDFEDIFYKFLYKSRNVLKYSTFIFSCQLHYENIYIFHLFLTPHLK